MNLTDVGAFGASWVPRRNRTQGMTRVLHIMLHPAAAPPAKKHSGWLIVIEGYLMDKYQWIDLMDRFN